ncbi:hypothetical protein [Gloeocapsopsis dulcis]|uniref:hypothetical protein n=1 Tax=Gloeocapsopsis dulcis TaxID=2859516 RepID=UPI0018C6AC39|nr:hypothetical protein [Gloeocapsopsis dulcis]WNN89453.1 hypothetical protein P0S91_25005 [Gloeocapsopsis dulcis]
MRFLDIGSAIALKIFFVELDKVRQYFEQEAFNYDSLISKLIPYYHEQHRLMLNLISFARTAEIKVLDLGTGTGILAYLILKNFPQV